MNLKFEWDENKNKENYKKHGVTFAIAKRAFADPDKIVIEDISHSQKEKRYFCFGKISKGILTVRFTYRSNTVRIFGAGYWRGGKKRYEKENKKD